MKAECKVTLAATEVLRPPAAPPQVPETTTFRIGRFFGTDHMRLIRGVQQQPKSSAVDMAKGETAAKRDTAAKKDTPAKPPGVFPQRDTAPKPVPSHDVSEQSEAARQPPAYPPLPASGQTTPCPPCSQGSPSVIGHASPPSPFPPKEVAKNPPGLESNQASETEQSMKEVLQKLEELAQHKSATSQAIDSAGRDKGLPQKQWEAEQEMTKHMHVEKPPPMNPNHSSRPTAPPIGPLQEPVLISSSEGIVVKSKQAGNRWSGVIRDAILEGEWQAASAVAFPIALQLTQTGPAAEWKPYDWKLLQQTKTTVTQYGLHSEVAKNIIHYLFTLNIVCPNDCMNIARLLLTPSQYLLRERVWERQAQREAQKPQQVGDPLYAVQVEQLTGRGAYAATNVQLTFPIQMHHAAAATAEQAMLSIPHDQWEPSFTNVKQGQTENFSNFVNQLHEALERHPDLTTEMRSNMFKILAFDNANSKTKMILSMLLNGASVDKMVEKMAKQDLSQNAALIAEVVKGAVRGQTQILAAALKQQGKRVKESWVANCTREDSTEEPLKIFELAHN
ncbi:uncharacterized protein LOC134565362 isoform X2 [Prinia subflava]